MTARKNYNTGKAIQLYETLPVPVVINIVKIMVKCLLFTPAKGIKNKTTKTKKNTQKCSHKSNVAEPEPTFGQPVRAQKVVPAGLSRKATKNPCCGILLNFFQFIDKYDSEVSVINFKLQCAWGAFISVRLGECYH